MSVQTRIVGNEVSCAAARQPLFLRKSHASAADHDRTTRAAVDYSEHIKFGIVKLSHVESLLTFASAAANGPAGQARSATSPNAGSPAPNGKAGSPPPYVERSNPMAHNGSAATQTVSSKDPKAAALAASDMRNVVRRKLTGYVGFANLPNQWHRKSVRKGFNFNVMVVGMCIARSKEIY